MYPVLLAMILMLFPLEVIAEKAQQKPKKNMMLHTFKMRRTAQQKRVEAIHAIDKLLKETKEPHKLYELLIRQGELYAEQAEFALEREIIVFDRQAKKLANNNSDKLPKIDHTASKKSLEAAVRIYSRIINKFDQFPGIDAVHYELAKNLLRLEDNRGAAILKKLIKDHQKSNYIPDAYYTLGDHYFAISKTELAKQYYESAAQYKESRVYPYAIYKLAWTHYNRKAESEEDQQKNYSKAATALKLVIRLSMLKENDQGGHLSFLKEEAINDLIMVWAEAETIDNTKEYFKSIGSEESYYKMLEKLADIYIYQGKHANAVATLQQIIKEVPLRESNPENYLKITDILKEKGKHDHLIDYIEMAIHQFINPSGKWHIRYKQNKELLEETKAALKNKIHRYSTSVHKFAQKSKNKAELGRAAKLYLIFLENFLPDPIENELRFYLADILFEIKQHEAAAKHYFLVAESGRNKYQFDSALNAIDAVHAAIAEKNWPAPQKMASIPKPLQIDPLKLLLIQYVDFFIKNFPERKEIPAMQLSAAGYLYDYGHYDKAIERFESIIQKTPSTDQSKKSVEVIFDHFIAKKDWVKIIAYGKTFLKTNNLLSSKLKAKTIKLLIDSSFELGISYEKQNKFDEAIVAFLSFEAQFKKDKRAPTALYNAFTISVKQGDFNKSINITQKLFAYANYPKLADVILELAKIHESLGKFEDALQLYTAFVNKFPKHSLASKANFSAALMAIGSEEWKKAFELLTDQYTSYTQDKELAKAAQIEKIELLNHNKHHQLIIENIDQLLKRSDLSASEIMSWKIQLLIHMNFNNPTKTIDKQIYSQFKRVLSLPAHRFTEARVILSQFYMNQAEQDYQKFTDHKISIHQLENSLVETQSFLEEIVTQYKIILQLGVGEYVVGANYRIGLLQQQFAHKLTHLDLADKFTPQEKAQIESQLAQISREFTQSAQLYKNTALEQRANLDSLSSWDFIISQNKEPQLLSFSPNYIDQNLYFDPKLAQILE